MVGRSIFTDEQREFLLEHQADISRKEMAELLNVTFGTSFTTQQITTYCANHGINSNITGYFKKGQSPMNKGKKIEEWMSPQGIERTKSTRFQRGQPPVQYRPVGSERVTKDGYIKIKTDDPSTWKLKHRVVWEEEYGEVPDGHAILFLDQNKTNCSLENLVLVKRSELARIANSGNLSEYPEVNSSVVTMERMNQIISDLEEEN